MDVKMGSTTVTCKRCGAANVVENEVLETIREYVCPSCGARMTDYELARLKMHYYILLYGMYRDHWGNVKHYEKFDYSIDLWPHFELQTPQTDGTGENRTDQGVIT